MSVDPLTAAALLSGALASLAALGGTWLRSHAQRHRAREEARRDHLRYLPPGSRLLDLGRHGMVIELGRSEPHDR